METVYYEDPEVCVTSERVIVRGRNVPLREVGGVEQIIEEPAKIGWPAVSMCVCAVAMMLNLGRDLPEVAFMWLVGALFSGVWMAATGTWYLISLVETERSGLVVATKNESFARDVVRAIRSALSEQRDVVPRANKDDGQHRGV